MEYSRTFGSKFPEKMIALGSHKNIDALSAPVIALYNKYIQNNEISKAYELYEENKTLLEPYMINSDKCNYWEEELYNTGLMALSQQISIISNEEPIVEQFNGSCWYQEY